MLPYTAGHIGRPDVPMPVTVYVGVRIHAPQNRARRAQTQNTSSFFVQLEVAKAVERLGQVRDAAAQ